MVDGGGRETDSLRAEKEAIADQLEESELARLEVSKKLVRRWALDARSGVCSGQKMFVWGSYSHRSAASVMVVVVVVVECM